ncbi:Bug family tripartite tricarboxylate transporter substrate binding protein [Comamonas odontotermitis]|uniref:Bug family tripartite tricarboxylate transporter substrate binding protein n=1 Tax=Comamonas TaxID=283 RepID=UPI001CC5AFD0|nr:tripartite tricarboxylate transporter substrate binding protein [Comamonas odontotermitis]UBB18146.1 tripartite tricarboxylate transporter substrate binding protein [Comamonas odontotermitis]
MQRRNLLLSAVLAASTLAAPGAFAEPVIRLVVPYAPGGPLDVTSRVLAERVRDQLGTVVVDNKAGAGGNIGADIVAKAAPDGLTIGLAATATHAVNPWLYSKMPFDAGKDFAAITQMVRVPNVLVMNAQRAQSLGINNVADLIAYAKKNPGKLNYGSGGNGSAGHLAGEMMKRQAGIFAVHVPYRGANPAQLALLSGEVDFNIDNLAAASANIHSGKLKALAVTSLHESPMLPGVQPLANTLKGFEIDTWWGLVAPAGTPAEVINRLNKAFTDALKDPATKTKFAGLMAEPVPTTPAQFDKFMAAERNKYESVVKMSGAKVD